MILAVVVYLNGAVMITKTKNISENLVKYARFFKNTKEQKEFIEYIQKKGILTSLNELKKSEKVFKKFFTDFLIERQITKDILSSQKKYNARTVPVKELQRDYSCVLYPKITLLNYRLVLKEMLREILFETTGFSNHPLFAHPGYISDKTYEDKYWDIVEILGSKVVEETS